MNNRYLFFWVSAALLVIIIALSAWYFYIPYTKLILEQRQKAIILDGQIENNERFVAAVNSLKRQEKELDNLYQLSRLALPSKPDAEILRLQLIGLLRESGINAKTDVPFIPSDSKEGFLTAQITGSLSFAQTQELITRLRNLIRWNKISAIRIEVSDQGTRTTLDVEFFWEATGNLTFSGSANLIERVSRFFANYRSYATIPDIEREGSFGRDDPFDPIQ